MINTQPSSKSPTVFKSAFGHYLRSSPPVSVSEHLSHFILSVLGGQYVYKVCRDPQTGKLSFYLELPNYAEDSKDALKEGEIVIEDGDSVGEEEMKMLQQARSTITPVALVKRNARGALLTLFEYASDELERFGESESDLLHTLRISSYAFVQSALKELQQSSETVQSTITEMDALIAEAEKSILVNLRGSVPSESTKIAEYLDNVIQLHEKMVLDTSVDDDPVMESGSCCSGGGCCSAPQGMGGCCQEDYEEDCCSGNDNCCNENSNNRCSSSSTN